VNKLVELRSYAYDFNCWYTATIALIRIYLCKFQILSKKDRMKSKAHIKGHPLHPILVCFPIAFFTGALIFDILALLNGQDFYQTATHLLIAGLIGGLVAAIPGLIDLLFTVPPKSSGKKRGIKHGLINLTAIILFGTALFYRLQVEPPAKLVVAGLEAAGVILLGFAGWMGGTLVYRNQIGVNPRYAGAGKWKEEYLEAINDRVEFTNAGELALNQMRLIHVGGKRIVVAKTAIGWVAFNDHCTHKGGSLAGGAMICETVQCPWHGSQFDVKTGNVIAGPAKEKIIVYPLEEVNGKLYIKIGSAAKAKF
jgi:uncharacterized membrane protein/nitrite reductase/ring-hydroxylating ferredoxin subunit